MPSHTRTLAPPSNQKSRNRVVRAFDRSPDLYHTNEMVSWSLAFSERRHAHELFRLGDHMRRADEQGRALVQGCRHEVENSALTVGGFASRLLDDECQRIAFVEEAQFAFGRFGRRGITKDPAFEK